MRAAFVTIGQSPRTDLVPELRRWIGPELDVVELGALDGLTDRQIIELAPRRGEHHLVTRLKSGREVVVGKRAIRTRVQRLLTGLDRQRVDFAVLLCTGRFTALRAPCLLLESQAVVDHGVASLAASAASVGVLVPLREQVRQFRSPWPRAPGVRVTHASPYRPDRLVRAAKELARNDLIVMHCIGYTERMRRGVAATSGRPVLLARRMVAGAISQLL